MVTGDSSPTNGTDLTAPKTVAAAKTTTTATTTTTTSRTKTKRKPRRVQQDVAVIRTRREPRRYVSKHFTATKVAKAIAREVKKLRGTLRKEVVTEDDAMCDQTQEANKKDERSYVQSCPEVVQKQTNLESPQLDEAARMVQGKVHAPRVFFGLNVDELSSDSELSDVPEDLGPDPFASGNAVAIKKSKKSKKQKKPSVKISPYFPDILPRHKPRPHFLATLPFPPLSADRFGLMQERLASDPFRLLLATIFLNKTPGARAMPIFYDLMAQYPTPRALARADVRNVSDMIHSLGFQNQRAAKCVAFAKGWVEHHPTKGVRFRKLNYPKKGDGKDIKESEHIDDDDDRVAWEISHLPGIGPYSHDSWRMFCRDRLRGVAEDWLGTNAQAEAFVPEWKRVLPADKELRAWMTWMWLKEGWIWNKETGECTKADERLMEMARGGGVVVEEAGKEELTVKGTEEGYDYVPSEPAGEFMPGDADGM